MEFLAALEQHRIGIFVAFAMLAGVCVVIQWICWIAGWGRFDPGRGGAGARNRLEIRHALAELMTMLINDFRHLLALIVVALFGLMTFVAVWPGLANADAGQVTDGLQSVTAAMGGLLGSIIGYYFGAMAAKKPGPDAPAPAPAPAAASDEPEDVRSDENVP